MERVLIVYSTADGQTLRIAERMAQVIGERHETTLVAVEDVGALRPETFDRIVVGARIRYGRHSPLVVDFVRRHRELLESRPCGFFSVNLVARKAAKNRPETNPYARKFLARTGWHPRWAAVFAGRVDYPRYNTVDRLIIRFIMWLTDGPTDPATTQEFTDWRAVEEFAGRVAS